MFMNICINFFKNLFSKKEQPRSLNGHDYLTMQRKRDKNQQNTDTVMIYVGSRLILDVVGGVNENFVGKTKESVFDQMSVFAMESVVDLIDASKNKESYSERVVRFYAENYNEEEHISILGYNEKGEVVETVLNNHVDN